MQCKISAKFFNVNELFKDDVEDCWLCLMDVINNMMENLIPKITNASNNIIKSKWFTIEV